MCGISGIFAYGGAAEPVDREELGRITRQMAPRGPDAEGLWTSADGRVGLGSRRLAIQDLSHSADQPMTDGDFTIVFNGEIYNQRELRRHLEAQGAAFRTTSDTEVLLHLYRREGERMVELLRGMFSILLWDARARRLFVSRGPYGIKPLYYSDDRGVFRAASQVKALLEGRVSRTRDPAGLASFFLTGSVVEPFTTFDAIRAVEPGTSFFVDDRGMQPLRRFYSIAATLRKASEQRSIARLTTPETRIAEAVEESVGYHLVSDVPVGIFLSSGIDSTAVLKYARAHASQPLHALTVTIGEYRGTANDELPQAQRFAELLGVPHTAYPVTREEFAHDLPAIFAAMDQPSIDGVNSWFVSKAAAKAGLKVALSGVGGDELFGSYPSFRDVPRIRAAARMTKRMPLGRRILEKTFEALTIRGRSNPKLTAVVSLGDSWGGAWLVKRGLYMPWELPAVMRREEAREGLRKLDLVWRIESGLDPDPGTPFGRVAALEATMYMRNQLLRDTDWASMAHSVEVRTPLVDAWLLRQIAPVVFEYGSASKQALAAVLPPELRSRVKTGFLVPIAKWAGLEPDGTTTRMRSWSRLVAENVY